MNKRFTSIFLTASILFTSGFNFNVATAEKRVNANLSDSLLGYYTFDDDSVNNLIINNLASTGELYNGKLGSLSNSERTNIEIGDGIKSKGLQFDGTESYFRLPQIINTKKDYTISFWLNNDSDQPTDGTSINIVQQTGSGRTVLYLKSKKYGTFVSGGDIISEKTQEYGAWQHIVVTSTVNENKTITFKIYVNGELDKEETIQDANSIYDGITDLQFGCHKNSNTGYSLKGKVDSVRIYNKSADYSMINELFKEHGSIIVFNELQNMINSATDLLENGVLTDEHEEFRALLSKLEEVKKLNINSSYDQLINAKSQLELLINNYNEAVRLLPVNIVIDTTNEVKTIPDYMFGVNHRYHMDGYGSYNPDNNELYPEFKELYESANFGSVRYPGGIVANLFQWKRSIGNEENRMTTIHGDWNQPSIVPNFGLDEAAKYIIEDNNGEMIYVYGFGNGSALDAADLVEYLNCEVGENPNGGIDWANVRADSGRTEPYNVKNFEIGNEVDEGRGYWMQNSPDQWSGSGLDVATMYAEGALRTFVKEKVAEIDNWNTSNDKSKASYFSDGTANQKKYMRYANDVTDQVDKSKAVQQDSVHVYVNNEEWTIVRDMKEAGPNEKVVQINYENGEILFGDNVNGAIPNNNADIRVSYTVYKDGLADYYDEMKKVDNDIKIYSGYSNSNIAQAVAQSEKASKDGGKFDGIAVHPYSRSNGQIQDNDPLFYEKIMEKINTSVFEQVRSRQNALNRYWNDGSKEVVISEYGIFNHPGDVVQSQTHAIYIATNLIGFMDFNTGYTNKHCLIDFPGGDILGPGKQDVIQSIKQDDGTYRFYGTPSLKVFSIFNEMSANILIDTRIINNRKFYNDVDSIYAMTTKDDDNLYVILVNMDREESIEVDINVNGSEVKGGKIKTMTLSGTDVYDVNSLDNPNNVDIVRSEEDINADNIRYEVPAHSIVGLKLPLDNGNVEVDFSKLEEAIESAKELDKEIYTPESWTKFENALNKAKAVLYNEEATQEQVDDAYLNLLKAKEALVLIEESDINKTALEFAINYAEQKITEGALEGLVPIVVREFSEALEEAKAVYGSKEATEAEVDVAFKRLTNAIHMLEFKQGDKEELKSIIDMAEALEEKVYTSSSWENLLAELEKANGVLADENAMQAEVDEAINKLQSAIDRLEVKNVNKEELQGLVDRINGLNKDEYIPSTWAGLEPHLTNAISVLGNEDATKEEVDEVYNALMRVFLELRLQPDKSKLEDLINNIKSMDLSKYTKASVDNLNAALAKANEVLANKEAAEDDISIALTDLEKAKNSLVAISGNSTNGETNSESNSETSGNPSNGSSSLKLPKTGSVVSAFVVIALGVVIVGAGLFMAKKKKED